VQISQHSELPDSSKTVNAVLSCGLNHFVKTPRFWTPYVSGAGVGASSGFEGSPSVSVGGHRFSFAAVGEGKDHHTQLGGVTQSSIIIITCGSAIAS